jgi:hypothetical protein
VIGSARASNFAVLYTVVAYFMPTQLLLKCVATRPASQWKTQYRRVWTPPVICHPVVWFSVEAVLTDSVLLTVQAVITCTLKESEAYEITVLSLPLCPNN